jgi:hypothetical protein
MSILIGVLLYALCIAWLCALTGTNRLDDVDRTPGPQREPAPEEAAAAARVASAFEAHG